MRYLAYLLPCLLAEIVAVFAAFVLPCFAANGWLPRALSYFQTPDNSLFGDAGHRQRWAGKNEYLQQVAWLLRNRAYGFKLGPLGCDYAVGYVAHGNPRIKNRDDAVAGWCIWQSAFGWYVKAVAPIGSEYCIQLALGWQLDAPINGRCLFMFSPRITKFFR